MADAMEIPYAAAGNDVKAPDAPGDDPAAPVADFAQSVNVKCIDLVLLDTARVLPGRIPTRVKLNSLTVFPLQRRKPRVHWPELRVDK